MYTHALSRCSAHGERLATPQCEKGQLHKHLKPGHRPQCRHSSPRISKTDGESRLSVATHLSYLSLYLYSYCSTTMAMEPTPLIAMGWHPRRHTTTHDHIHVLRHPTYDNSLNISRSVTSMSTCPSTIMLLQARLATFWQEEHTPGQRTSYVINSSCKDVFHRYCMPHLMPPPGTSESGAAPRSAWLGAAPAGRPQRAGGTAGRRWGGAARTCRLNFLSSMRWRTRASPSGRRLPGVR